MAKKTITFTFDKEDSNRLDLSKPVIKNNTTLLKGIEVPKTKKESTFNIKKPKINNSTLLFDASRVLDKTQERLSKFQNTKYDANNTVLGSGGRLENLNKIANQTLQDLSTKNYTIKNATVSNTSKIKNIATTLESLQVSKYTVSGSFAAANRKSIEMQSVLNNFPDANISFNPTLSSRENFSFQLKKSEDEKSFKDFSLTAQLFSVGEENSADSVGWFDRINEKALIQLSQNSNNLLRLTNNTGLQIQSVPKADNRLANSLDNAVESTKTVFGKGRRQEDYKSYWSSKAEQLNNSNSVSYVHFLPNLDQRVDATNNDESFAEFSKKLFGRETWEEIGATFTDAATEIGLGFIKSLIPDLRFIKKEDKSYKEAGFGKGGKLDHSFKRDFRDFNYSVAENDIWKDILGEEYSQVSTVIRTSDTVADTIYSNASDRILASGGGLADLIELNILGKLEISTNHSIARTDANINKYTRVVSSDFSIQDQSELFTKFVANNPLLSQYQFNLSLVDNIKDQQNTDTVKELTNDSDIIKNLIKFRIRNISIPNYSRPVDNSNYGVSILSTISSLQPSADYKADITIICDKNLDVLDYLIRKTGLGLRENKIGDTSKYNLSTVTNVKTNSFTATLSTINGRDINKSLRFENLDWNFAKNAPTASYLGTNYSLDFVENGATRETASASRDTVIYAYLPEFTFENFKFINLDYNFSFEASTTNSKLLEIKATVTWTKLYTTWKESKDTYRKPLVSANS